MRKMSEIFRVTTVNGVEVCQGVSGRCVGGSVSCQGGFVGME